MVLRPVVLQDDVFGMEFRVSLIVLFIFGRDLFEKFNQLRWVS